MLSDSNNDYITRLHRLIPGGAHTYSRGDDQFPSNAPAILEKGKGAYVWDPRGNKFLDYGMALRAVTLGYADEDVNAAAFKGMENGVNLTRATTVELEAAELLSSIIPCAEMVKFAKNGSTVTSAAVKLARAYTGRPLVVFPAEHPFFSYDDWFIGSTVMDKGVPDEEKKNSLIFHYNDIGSLEKLFSGHPGRIAAVILEPATTVGPEDKFLHKVKELCSRNGTVFILDEMITGFRWDIRGAQAFFDIKPDLATFGKGMANGFSVAALAGKKEIMELGGITKEGAERVFLISTTHGAEMHGLSAFVKTMEIYRKRDVVAHLWAYGEKLVNGINEISSGLGIKDYFYAEGYPCSPAYVTKGKDGAPSPGLRTLFSQEMIKNNVLMPYIAISFSHGEKELDITLYAVKKALEVYRRALEEGYEKYLSGKVIRPVFRKYN